MAAAARPLTSSKYWCFTLFGTTEDFENLRKYLKISTNEIRTKYTYFVMQVEQCPDTYRKHMQGYFELSEKKSMTRLKDMLQSSCIHLEIARGTGEDNRAYCTKEASRIDGPWEDGVIKNFGKGQGVRNDILAFRDHFVRGGKRSDILFGNDEGMLNTYAKYRGLVSDFQTYRPRIKRTKPLEVWVFWGEAGTGKTRKAVNDFLPYMMNTITVDGKMWADGYDGDRAILLDEYRGELRISEFLKMTDPWQYMYNMKIHGGFVSMDQLDTLIITSNVSPGFWYPDIDERSWEGIKRRLEPRCYYFKNDAEPVLNLGPSPKECQDFMW